jgi:cell division protein FtsI/penicillin-binding protein 2
MANYPTYNPAKYNEVKDYSVFQNGIVSEPYEAGSVMKTLTVGTGLDMGKIRPDTHYNNTGSVQVADATIHNALRFEALGNITIQDALHFSLNTGMVEVLKHLGDGQLNARARQTLYDYLVKHYLFGKKTGIEQSGEAKGTVIPPTEVQGNNVRYANMTFGQGMDVTMVQVASAFSAAINGGTYYQPHLVDGVLRDGEVRHQAPHVVKNNVLKRDVSLTLRGMVEKARQDGFLGDTDREGYMVGGKTGTSQIIDPRTGEYTDDNSIGSYLGFGGDTEPKYVIMVQVRDSKLPGYAGTVAAAPIFGDISNWLIDYMKLQPR